MRIDVGQVGHALLIDQIAQAGQQFEQARDDLVEQARQFIAGGRTRLLESRFALGAPIHPIEHQAMQMDVQVGGRTQSLYQRDRAGVGCGAPQACLLEQIARDDAVDDAQQRREQFGARREQDAQLGKLSIPVPTGLGISPKELRMPPKSWCGERTNVKRWTAFPLGGRFAPAEHPEQVVPEYQALFRALR